MTVRLVMALLALVLAAPAAASQGAPEDLWREYPLDPAVTSPGRTSVPAPTTEPRLTPPTQQREVPSGAVGAALSETDGGVARVWWIVGAAVLVAAGVAVVGLRRRLEAMPARAAVDVWSRTPRTRMHSGALRRFADAAEAARAPVTTPVECVVRREGVVRSRFVAEVEPQAGRERLIASSRSFWRKGYGGKDKEGEARGAWNDLMKGLQADGWQIAPAWGAQERVEPDAAVVADDVRLVRGPKAPIANAAADAATDATPSPRKPAQGQSRSQQARRPSKHRRRSRKRR